MTTIELFRAGPAAASARVTYRDEWGREKALLKAGKALGLDRRYYTGVPVCQRVAGCTYHVQFGHQIKGSGQMLSELFIAHIPAD